MFLVVSRSDVHFCFDRRFFAYPLGGASKIARPESRVPRKKLFQPWMLLKMIFFADIFVLFRRFFVNFVKLTDPNTILIMMIWCKSRGSKWFRKIWSLLLRTIGNLKRNDQKQFKKKSLNPFSVSRQGWQLKWRTLIEKFALFKLHVSLSIITLYKHDITFSDICNFLVTGNLICKILFFVKYKTHWA